MKSSSVGTSRYRGHHASSDIAHHHPDTRSKGSSAHYKLPSQDRDLIAYSPSSTPGSVTPFDNIHYSDGYGSHSSRQLPFDARYHRDMYPPDLYASFPTHQLGYTEYNAPTSPVHSRRQSSSFGAAQHRSHSMTSQPPITVSNPNVSVPSEVSQYSLSNYKPIKPRFRIEQEGRSLVVMPSETPPSPPTVPSPPSSPPLLKRWPPHQKSTLTRGEAEDLISRGAPGFRGEVHEIPNGPRGDFQLFAFAGEEWHDETDTAAFQCDSFGDMSSSPEGRQTDALEHPAMGHAFGVYPGTVTLSYYVAGFGNQSHGFEIATKGKVRKQTMLYVLDRLRTLQVKGIEEDLVDLHDHLYGYLLYDSHKFDRSEIGPSLETQINDLVAALCRPAWVDFSYLQNQTVAQFLASEDSAISNSFFHQLLLSVELHLRIKARSINSRRTNELPEKIRWDLILAQRWLENVEIEPPKKVKDGTNRNGEQKSSVGFKFPNKRNQIGALREFAWTLKWPNMPEVEYVLSEEDGPHELLEDRSLNCMSWFTGLLLPGKSMPFILMDALIDCDVDTPKEFKNLQQTLPNIGFQYRGCTYWTWECIVGKVLGAALGVTQIAGWIGPCSASADLERSEVAVINQTPPRCHRLSISDVRDMDINSDAIGPDQDSYPVSDYSVPEPSVANPVDSIRIERLNFSPAACNPKDIHRQGLEQGHLGGKKPLVTFDASITFAITVQQRARSWKVSLRHDTPFIAAYPCQDGPHVLFCEYNYQKVRVDELVDIQNWGLSANDESDDEESGIGKGRSKELEEVLVVEAFGVADNEVFARAWCSFWGLPSLTADISRTCVSCAIREAYSALISVVILVDRENIDTEVEEVDRLMGNL